MSVPDVIYGINTVVDGVSNLGTLELKYTSSSQKPIFTSSGAGGAMRKCGNVDFTGFYHAFGHTPSVWLNDIFTFKATLADNAAYPTHDAVSGSAICTGIDVFIPVGEKQMERSYINYVVHFGAVGGALSFAPASAADGGVLAMFCAQGLSISLDDSMEPNVEWIELSFRSRTAPYVNSSLNGVYSRPTGNIDWTCKYHRNVNSLALCPAIDSVSELKVYVTPTLYYDLKWGIFSQPFSLQVSVEAMHPITAEIEANMTGASGTSLGFIKLPSGTSKWP